MRKKGKVQQAKKKTKNSPPAIPKVTDTGLLVYGSYITIL